MNIELKMLAWTVALGLLQIVVGASVSTHLRGLGWNMSSRDVAAPALTGAAARLDRAFRNLLETFPFFAAAAIAVVVTQHTTAGTALGAQIYFWARLAYVGIYAAGIPYLRTAVWGTSMAGLVMVLLPLF